MKTFLFAFLVTLSFNCFAFDEWSFRNKALEGTFLTVHAVDWLQTRNIARNCGPNAEHRRAEMNAFLGECPNINQVNKYFFATALLHIGFTTILDSKYRTAFQFSTITMSLIFVSDNFKIGISADY